MLDLSKTVMYEFWYDVNQNMVKKKNFVMWIQTVSDYY